MNVRLNRDLLIVLAMVLIAAISFSVGFTINPSTPATGSIPVYTGTGSDWNASAVGDLAGTPLAGIILKPDQNSICFPTASATCDKNIVWDGTNLIISSN
jgi:hypothetical protein